MRMKKLLLVFPFLLIILSGCDFFGLMKNNLALQEAPIVINIGTGDRFGTILPDMPTPDNYRISYLSGPTEKTPETFTQAQLPLSLNLALGKWTLKAEALKNGVAFASQTKEVTIDNGTNTLDFILQPDYGGNGNISYSITWPSGIEISSVYGKLTHKTDGTNIPVKFTVSGQTAAGLSSNIKGGDYYLLVSLKNSEGRIQALDDGIVRVGGGLTTNVSLTFEERHFNGTPLLPIELSTHVDGNNIILEWTDTSWNETGFVIERKLTSDDAYSEIATTAADAESYTDNAIEGNKIYDYRIKSRNPSGDSDPTVSVSVRSLNQDADILSFQITDDDEVTHTIAFDTNNNAEKQIKISDFSSVSPQITVSSGASVSPISGASVDFSNGPVTFTVVSESGTEKVYTLSLNGLIIYVTYSGAGTKSGTSWGNAMNDLQAAINKAMPGSQIWVASGQYHPTEGTGTDKHFNLKDGVALYGGFSGNESELSSRNISSGNSLLSGDIDNNDTTDGYLIDGYSDNVKTIIYYSGMGTETITIDGFYLMGGISETNGSAANIENVAHINFSNNKIINNLGTSVSFTDYKTAEITNNMFTSNYSESSSIIEMDPVEASIVSEAQLVEFTNNKFEANKTLSGTILNYKNNSSNLRLTANWFRGNLCGGDFGTAFYCYFNSSSTDITTLLHRNIFEANSVIYNEDYSSASPITITGTGSASRKFITHSNVIVNSNLKFIEDSEGSYPASGNGGIWIEDITKATLINDTIVKNYGASVAAVYSQNGTATDVYNAVITDNSKSSGEVNDFGIGSGGSIKIYESALQDFSDPEYLVNNGGANTVTRVNCINIDNSIFKDISSPSYEGDWLTEYDGLQLISSSVLNYCLLLSSESTLGYDLNNDGDTDDSYTVLGDIYGNNRNSGLRPEPGAYEAQDNYTNIATIYVDKDAVGTENGFTWTDAYTNLQPAIERAKSYASDSNPIEIWIAEGTYYPTSWPSGIGSADQEKHFLLYDNVELYGGFSGEETLLSQRDISGNEVILSGDLGENDNSVKSDNTKNIFYFPSGKTVTPNKCLIDGITLTGVYSITEDNKSGAIYSYEDGPSLNNVTITQNTTVDAGSGISLNSGNTAIPINNCHFTYNISQAGGAAIKTNVPVNIDNCSFENNRGYTGGAILIEGSELTLTNSSFSNNEATYDGNAGNGGAINASDAIINIENTDFSNNAASRGTALCLNNLKDVDLVATPSKNYLSDCNFISNQTSPSSYGSGAAVYIEGTFRIKQTIFKANTAGNGCAAIYHSNRTGMTDILYCYNTVFDENSAADGDIILTMGFVKMIKFVFYNNSAHRLVHITGGGTPVERGNWLQNGTIVDNTIDSYLFSNKYTHSGTTYYGKLITLVYGPNTYNGGDIALEFEEEGDRTIDSSYFTNYESPISVIEDWFSNNCGLHTTIVQDAEGIQSYGENTVTSPNTEIDFNLDGIGNQSFGSMGDIANQSWTIGGTFKRQAGAYRFIE